LSHNIVTVVIVNWNGKKHLKGCLESLQKQSYQDFDTIIVDNGSNDGSVEYIQKNYPSAKLIQLKSNMGYSVGINMGLEQSKNKYLIALNNDTTLEENWLSELLKTAESDESIGSCQPKILSLQNPPVIDSVGLSIKSDGEAFQIGFQEKDAGQYDNARELLGACSAALFYRRRALMQIGGFDADFFAYFEDVDVALRLWKAGWKCMCVPSAVVYHYGSATAVNESPFKTYLLTRNEYYYRIKNQSVTCLLCFLTVRPAVISRKVVIFLKNRQLHGLLSYVKANLDGLKDFSKMYRKRV
jgi:GT2 family glycosyltransferase